MMHLCCLVISLSYFPTAASPLIHDSLPSFCCSLLGFHPHYGPFHDALHGYSGPLIGHARCHSSLTDYKGGLAAQSGPSFAPFPTPCERASASGTCPSMEKGKH